jgi:hypothetical protein
MITDTAMYSGRGKTKAFSMPILLIATGAIRSVKL